MGPTAAVLVAGLLAPLFLGRSPGVDATEFSAACPAIEAHSLQECDRCVSDDLCPVIGGVEYRCDNFHKKCVAPSWNSSEVIGRCPELRSDPATWGAMCKLACLDQQSPFGCAMNNCLNEDFPCNWVPGCSSEDNMRPFGVPMVSSACLRSCNDHEDFIQSLWDLDSCDAAKQGWGGCVMNSIWQYCPVSCATNECQTRCDREELPDTAGLRCWEHVQRDKVDCVDAIRKGMDCHCKCGGVYRDVSGTVYRNNGGAFTWKERVQGKSLDLQLDAAPQKEFSLSLTGDAMSAEEGVMNPARLKIVVEDSPCTHANNAEGVTGLLCEVPAGNDILAIAVCDTWPELASPWLHRWTGLAIDSCGNYDICHCNKGCNVRENWKIAGKIRVRPESFDGNPSQAPPGCAAYFPTQAPLPGTDGEDRLKEAVVRSALSITGGLLALYGLGAAEVLTAIQAALAEFLQSTSELLGKMVPELDDITLTFVARRRLRSLGARSEGPVIRRGAASSPPRLRALADDCVDDDAQFLSEATALGVPISTCSDGLAAAGTALAFCTDATLQTAAAHCALTCGTCGGGSGLGSSPTPAPQGETAEVLVTSTAAPTTTTEWPGGPEALKLRIEVQTWTDHSAKAIVARLEQLEAETTTFVDILYRKLDEAGLGMSLPDPSLMSVFVVEGPELGVAAQEAAQGTSDDETAEKTYGFFSETTLVIVGCAVGGTIFLGIAGSCCWCCLLRSGDNEVRVVADEEQAKQKQYRETVKRSEGGYRFKKGVEEVPDGGDSGYRPQRPQRLKKQRKRSCLARCCGCCASRSPRSDAQPPRRVSRQGGQLVPGATVQLTGLQAAPHFNGLVGTVVSGPNENGRYSVNLVLLEGDVTREHQTKAFKADNLIVIDDDQLRAAADVRGPETNSFRTVRS